MTDLERLRSVPEKGATEITGFPIKTLQNWRALRKGPPLLQGGPEREVSRRGAARLHGGVPDRPGRRPQAREAGEMNTELVGGREFLERYFRDCAGNNIELRVLHTKKNADPDVKHQKAYTDIYALLAAAGKFSKRYDVFFISVALNGGFTENHAVACPALRIDIDFKDGITEAEARELLAAFPLTPSAIIRTGGGLHVYWLLADPAGREDFGRVKAIIKSLIFTFRADTNAKDIPRVLRLPGTVNRKPDYPSPIPVTLARADWHPEREYSLSDFAALLPIEGEIKLPPAEKMAEADGAKLPIGRLAAVFEKCAELDGMRRNAIEGGRLLPEKNPANTSRGFAL